ncbi:MAG: biotin/lipoyl-containing protein, partial [Pseudomonadota bacterium]
MPTEVLMPALSPTMEEGTLAKWLVKEGDDVSSGDLLAEIETDKATMEFEAVDEGKIGKILVAEGTEGVLVNSPIAILVEDGEDVPEAGAAPASEAAAAPAASAEAPAPAPAPAAAAPAAPAPDLSPDWPTDAEMVKTTVREALRDAMAEEMRADETV